MRWLMLGICVLGFALAFVAKGPGLLGLGLLLGFVGLFGMVFSMAADRVSARARPESAMLAAEDLAAIRAARTARTAAPAAANDPASSASRARPPAPTRPPDPGATGRTNLDRT
jgi:hypothetical protein